MWADLFHLGAFTNGVANGVASVSGAVDTFDSSGFEAIASQVDTKAQNQAGATKNLQTAVNSFYEGSKDALDEWMKKTITGNFNSYLNPYSHIKDGIFLNQVRDTERELSKRITNHVIANSIFQTWKYKGPLAVIYRDT